MVAIVGLAYNKHPLRVGDRVSLMPEPNNPYDAKAIAVTNYAGVIVGHVARNDQPKATIDARYAVRFFSRTGRTAYAEEVPE